MHSKGVQRTIPGTFFLSCESGRFPSWVLNPSFETQEILYLGLPGLWRVTAEACEVRFGATP